MQKIKQYETAQKETLKYDRESVTLNILFLCCFYRPINFNFLCTWHTESNMQQFGISRSLHIQVINVHTNNSRINAIFTMLIHPLTIAKGIQRKYFQERKENTNANAFLTICTQIVCQLVMILLLLLFCLLWSFQCERQQNDTFQLQ